MVLWTSTAGNPIVGEQGLTDTVSALRRSLLDTDRQNPLILTIPRRGYQLRASLRWISRDGGVAFVAGTVIDGRPDWRLKQLLAEDGRRRRIFRFCRNEQQLRKLRREVVLMRYLREALASQEHGARIDDSGLECVAGAPASAASDVYALGVLIAQTLSGDFQQLEFSGFEVSPELAALLRECRAADPARRPTAAALAARLREQTRPQPAAPTPAVAPAPEVAPAVAPIEVIAASPIKVAAKPAAGFMACAYPHSLRWARGTPRFAAAARRLPEILSWCGRSGAWLRCDSGWRAKGAEEAGSEPRSLDAAGQGRGIRLLAVDAAEAIEEKAVAMHQQFLRGIGFARALATG